MCNTLGMEKPGIFRQPVFLIGLIISLVSALGILLAAGNLIAIKYTPDQLVSDLNEQFEAQLEEAGFSADLLTDLTSRLDLSTNMLADLPEEQRQLVDMLQGVLQNVSTPAPEAVPISPGKYWWGLGISGLLFCCGIFLMIREYRRAKLNRSAEPDDAPGSDSAGASYS